jgi:hypothetical protein
MYILHFHTNLQKNIGAFVIVWYLDLQLSIQSVAITTNVVSSNPALVTTLCDKVCQ